MAIRTLCSDSVRMAIHFFVNFSIFKWLYLACYWVYLHQTWGFVKLGLHSMTVIYRLVPSPSRFEIRQWTTERRFTYLVGMNENGKRKRWIALCRLVQMSQEM